MSTYLPIHCLQYRYTKYSTRRREWEAMAKLLHYSAIHLVHIVLSTRSYIQISGAFIRGHSMKEGRDTEQNRDYTLPPPPSSSTSTTPYRTYISINFAEMKMYLREWGRHRPIPASWVAGATVVVVRSSHIYPSTSMLRYCNNTTALHWMNGSEWNLVRSWVVPSRDGGTWGDIILLAL